MPTRKAYRLLTRDLLPSGRITSVREDARRGTVTVTLSTGTVHTYSLGADVEVIL